jgi:hypothetical protein
MDEPHAVVKLLVARMESHPEEFKRYGATYGDRWHSIVSDITEWGNEADKAAMGAALRDIRLGEAHEDMMDELCNGPERRRQQEEEAKYEQQLIMQKAMAQTLQQQQQQIAQKYAAQTQSFTPGLRGKSVTGTWIDDTYANTVNTANALQLGGETLNESILKKLKGLLK